MSTLTNNKLLCLGHCHIWTPSCEARSVSLPPSIPPPYSSPYPSDPITLQFTEGTSTFCPHFGAPVIKATHTPRGMSQRLGPIVINLFHNFIEPFIALDFVDQAKRLDENAEKFTLKPSTSRHLSIGYICYDMSEKLNNC